MFLLGLWGDLILTFRPVANELCVYHVVWNIQLFIKAVDGLTLVFPTHVGRSN